MGAPESYECGQDGHPEGNNVYEGQSWGLQTEEEVGPERVQSQLTEKQAQGANGVGQTVPAPNQPGGHSHHGVEQGPDRAEDPSGGRQGGLDQTAVPLPRLKPGTDPGGGEGDRQPEAQADPGGGSGGTRLRHGFPAFFSLSRDYAAAVPPKSQNCYGKPSH
jgi:hypothetical protein